MEEIPSISQELLKVDRRGHVRVPRARREALLDEFERCGVGAAEFAAHIGVKYTTFSHWKRCRDLNRARQTKANADTEAGKSNPVWLEAIPETPVLSSGEASSHCPTINLPMTALPVILPGGARVEISHPSQLRLAAGLLEMLRREGGASC